MKTLMVILCVSAGISNAVAEERQRDWTIEKPVLAGFLSGITITACRGCELGNAGESADRNDPFGMTPAVREELIRLAGRPFAIGQSFGVAMTLFLLTGIFFRRSNTLMAMESHQ